MFRSRSATATQLHRTATAALRRLAPRCFTFLLIVSSTASPVPVTAQTKVEASSSRAAEGAPGGPVEPTPAPADGPPIRMETLHVTSGPSAFLNSVDRKTYFVGREIDSTTGSASDLLQNIPSVQVDLDGGVSLRGSANVTILIDGRTSTLMGKSRAEVLQQLPADGIERIEVITNPSAKYKPDGTAGIINIVLKQKHGRDLAGTGTASVGNMERWNAGVSASYNPGNYNVFGNFSLRQDDRPRLATDHRRRVDPLTGAVTHSERKTEEHARPFTRIARLGFNSTPNEFNTIGATISYDHRSFRRRSIDRNVVRADDNSLIAEFDRTRDAPEFERSLEFSTTYQHKFAQADHRLELEFKSSRSHEEEDNHYADLFRVPAQAAVYDNTLIKETDRETEFMVGYAYPIGEESKLEAGYTGTIEKLDANFYAESFDPVTKGWIPDATRTNRFINQEKIHAFYGTLGRTIGNFAVLGGLRPEFVEVKTQLVTTGTTLPNDYARIYPSLHLAYKLTEQHELQLNYSHRVERPDSDDLNPFPEYSDPLNLRAGNPALLPEDTHSIEAGYGFHTDRRSITAAVYHRELTNGFTTVTRDKGNGILLTTGENLAESQATGFELTANGELGGNVSLNFSSNAYLETINAANLGFESSQSAFSWSAKLGATLQLPKHTLMQVNTNYVSSRVTPQGLRHPSFVASVGFKKKLLDRRMDMVLTVSDVFNSQKDGYILDTPTLRQEVARRRSSSTIYVGLIYRFGKSPAKSKDDQLKFDDAL